MIQLVKTRTHRTRDEIESDWEDQGFEMIFDEDDDQIWVDGEQEELFFVSWVAASVQVYKLVRTESLL